MNFLIVKVVTRIINSHKTETQIEDIITEETKIEVIVVEVVVEDVVEDVVLAITETEAITVMITTREMITNNHDRATMEIMEIEIETTTSINYPSLAINIIRSKPYYQNNYEDNDDVRIGGKKINFGANKKPGRFFNRKISNSN